MSDLSAWVQPTPANWPPKADPLPPSKPLGWLASWVAMLLLAWYALSYLMEYGRETVPWNWADPASFGYSGRGLTWEQRKAMAREFREKGAR